MLGLPPVLNPKSYFRLLRNLRGATLHPPGHFYSPLLDIQSFGPKDSNIPFDGLEFWEHVNLREDCSAPH